MSEEFNPDYARPSLDKRLNGRRGRFVKSATIRLIGLFPMHTYEQKQPENAAFLGRTSGKTLKEDFTIPAVGSAVWRIGAGACGDRQARQAEFWFVDGT